MSVVGATVPRVRTHIVWDWNGTLFHDMEAVLGASNAAFATIGVGPMTMQEYREQYEIPIPGSTGGCSAGRRPRRSGCGWTTPSTTATGS